MKVRQPYVYDAELASLEAGLDTGSQTPVIQSAKDECDINTIVARFGIGGEMPPVGRMPTYGDFTTVTDYRTALHAVRAAEERFMALPADVRRSFDNDPAAFVDFCADEKNAEQLRKWNMLSDEALEARQAQLAADALAAAVPAPKPEP